MANTPETPTQVETPTTPPITTEVVEVPDIITVADTTEHNIAD